MVRGSEANVADGSIARRLAGRTIDRSIPASAPPRRGVVIDRRGGLRLPRYAPAMDWLLPGVVGGLLGAAVAAAFLLWRAAAGQSSLRADRDRAAALAESAVRDREHAEARLRETESRLASTDSRREEAERTLAVERERLAALELRLADEAKRIEELKVSLRDAFRSVGQEVTQGGLEELKKSVGELVAAQKKQIDAEGETRRQAIEAQMKPIQEGLVKQGELLAALETRREVAYKELQTMVGSIERTHGELRDRTGKLVEALRRPETRGRWGEIGLRNAVEQAGLSPHCDFAEQVSVDTEDGRLRPDLVINLPGGGTIVVDSKVALDSFLSMLDAEADRPALLKKHAAAVAAHIKGLGQKRYWEQFARTPEFVVMFVPVESALVAAIEAEPTLFEEAIRQRVVLTGPMNLAAMLRVVAMTWREHDVAENARKIADEASELHKRLRKFAETLADVGRHLHRAGDAYNKAIGSFDGRLIPAARKMERYGVAKGEAIAALPPVEIAPKLPGSVKTASEDEEPIDVEAIAEDA
ncbi:MAG: DNA recombination protein RmuC [Phycisphaerales bacterium]